MLPNAQKDLEVKLKSDQGKAVIEGKTAVAFQAFVTLVLQRKVFGLFKSWGEEPVVVSAELLASLASAPQDSQENRAHLVTVTLGVGIVLGVFVMSVLQLSLIANGITLSVRELGLIAGGILLLAILARMLVRLQRRKRSDKVTEAMESLSSLLSK
jgi:hypothetical protein